MIEGIEILSSEIIYNTIFPEWCVLGFLLGGICFISMVDFFSSGYTWVGLLSLVSMIVFIVIGVLGTVDNTSSPNHIEYKVIIDESVSINEFLDKYEIIDQEGKIYTIKGRENNG